MWMNSRVRCAGARPMPTTGTSGSASPNRFSIPPGQDRVPGVWLSHESPEASVMMRIPGRRPFHPRTACRQADPGRQPVPLEGRSPGAKVGANGDRTILPRARERVAVARQSRQPAATRSHLHNGYLRVDAGQIADSARPWRPGEALGHRARLSSYVLWWRPGWLLVWRSEERV